MKELFNPKDYFRPNTTEKAISLLARYEKSPKPVTGDTDLLVDKPPNIKYLVDITHLPLHFIKQDEEGEKIVTIECLSERTKLNPLWEAFIEHGAIQCGFCTPGMILSAKALLDEKANPTKRKSEMRFPATYADAPATSRLFKPLAAAAKMYKEV